MLWDVGGGSNDFQRLEGRSSDGDPSGGGGGSVGITGATATIGTGDACSGALGIGLAGENSVNG